MQYTIRRIDLPSVGRVGCIVGWLVAFLPALCLAGLGVFILQSVNQAFEQVKPLTLSVLGQEVLRIDFLNVLQLQPLAQAIQPWAQNSMFTFVVLTVLLLLVGGILWMLTGLLVSVIYNLIARLGWGLTVDLVEAGRARDRKQN
jgi:hypothetical protein